ncbi:hypothetical protein [Streptomyces sp. H27-D2]|nr:hypothetical protein [Streptomyces sp. H27-D2]MEC4019065.1 hypothetical protein [Streptomyces sp. H27-D2]
MSESTALGIRAGPHGRHRARPGPVGATMTYYAKSSRLATRLNGGIG